MYDAAPLPEGTTPPELWGWIDTGPGPRGNPVPVGYIPPLPLMALAVPEYLGHAEATPASVAATKAEVRILKRAGYKSLTEEKVDNGRKEAIE